jgi:hypothetical protein
MASNGPPVTLNGDSEGLTAACCRTTNLKHLSAVDRGDPRGLVAVRCDWRRAAQQRDQCGERGAAAALAGDSRGHVDLLRCGPGD